ncbi:hypothetical protein OHB26_25070 [Nocardia sp. NBC_01503]|nr:hypothetical protein [Nocardia sp. NBC_01503]WTL30206.1 hypothetical protein OHB26_25070 [Nocardia sp. NBC_01503]
MARYQVYGTAVPEDCVKEYQRIEQFRLRFIEQIVTGGRGHR